MLDYDFYLDGIAASSKSIIMQSNIVFSEPEPRVEKVEIPGRNGAVLFFEGAYNNVKASLPCCCVKKDCGAYLTLINEWLIASLGYRKLIVTTEPDCYRLARIEHGVRINAWHNKVAEFVIDFDCKPQKYLRSGEYQITLENGQTLFNPTAYPAKPLIKVKGSGNGTLVIGGKTITLSGINAFIMLDSELMNCYKDDKNKNSTMTGDFPVLQGATQISWSGGITGVEITPRWYTI